VVALRISESDLEIMTHGGVGMRAAIDHGLQAHGFTAGIPDSLIGEKRWATLAAASSPAAVRWLLRHADGEPPFRREFLHRSPVVLITGPVNAGKSTLLNAWCGRDRAIVSDLPGTTRDLIAAETMVAGWRLRLFDSAGLRASGDALESAGQALVAQARGWADVVVYLAPSDAESRAGESEALPGDLVIHGKADVVAAPLAPCWSVRGLPGRTAEHLLADLGRLVLDRLGLPLMDAD